MELQEPFARTVITQLRWRPSPLFADLRGETIRELGQILDLPNWEYTNKSLRLFDADSTAKSVLLADDELRVVGDGLDTAVEYPEMVERAVEYSIAQLDVTELLFLGIRSYWCALTDSFDDLREALVRKFGGSAIEIVGAAISSKPSDVGWSFEYREKDPQLTTRFGPMTDEQMATSYGVALGFPPETFPPAFLFLDLDRVVNQTPIAAASGLEQWTKGYSSALSIGEKIMKGFVNGLT